MGLPIQACRFIAREHKRKAITGSVLTLGRQDLFATLEDLRRLLESERIPAAPLPPDLATGTNIPGWRDTPYAKNTSDVVFFKLLGASEVHALDCSDYEHPSILQDLNVPVPPALHDRFDLIVDGGTLEHVFDVRQALSNLARMAKPAGGRVLHISPASNNVNHGFYQFSPTLFYDFYSANRFTDLRGFIAENELRIANYPWDIFEVGVTGHFASPHSLLTLFVAEKTPQSTADQVPTQSRYLEAGAPGEGSPREAQSRPLRGFIKHLVPESMRVRLKPYYGWFEKYIRWIDPHRKPWGLRRWDRF